MQQAAILQVAIEARLVDAHDRAEAHGHGGEFPEIGHQPRVRVRGQATAGLELVAEVFELLLRQTSFQEGAGVDARRGVALEVHLIAPLAAAGAADEVVEGDFVQGRRRGVGRNVTADVGIDTVGAHHHGHGVPAHQALDAALDLAAARKRRLVFYGYGIKKRRRCRIGQRHTSLLGVHLKLLQQGLDALRATALQHVVEGFQPLLRLDGFKVVMLYRNFRVMVHLCHSVGQC